ncbi:MAG: hypothetical protein WA063_00855 [Minisyncoccia bacterium]
MINKKFIKSLRNNYEKKEAERSHIIGMSNKILSNSKKAIFSLHRDDIKGAEEKLSEAEEIMKKMKDEIGYERMSKEGSYAAASEEYVEAKMFYFFMTGKKIDKIEGACLGIESYLGGMCDLAGELVRRAVKEATEGRLEEVERISLVINEIMAELIEFNMTGALRTKYDQAKHSLKNMEKINYDIKVKR